MKDVKKLILDLSNSARVFNTIEELISDLKICSQNCSLWIKQSAKELLNILEAKNDKNN